jgi:lipoate---protein ligase
VLHHTTMAYQMNVPLMLQVLRIGKEKLSDKGITSADKRVGPLRQQTDLPRDAIVARIVGTFREKYGLSVDAVTDDEMAEAERLVETRFGTEKWIYFLP